MKTITISIPGSATRDALKAIMQNNLKHQFIGIDHNFNLLVKILYSKDHEETIQNMIQTIERIDAVCKELGQFFDEAFTKLQKESEQLLPKKTIKSYKELFKKEESVKEH